jgi:hypothetical protein
MFFYSGDVMANIIDKLQSGFLFASTEYLAEGLSYPVGSRSRLPLPACAQACFSDTHPSRTMTYRTLSACGLPYSLPSAQAVPTLYRIFRHIHPPLTITHRTLPMYSLPSSLAVPTLSHSHSNLLARLPLLASAQLSFSSFISPGVNTQPEAWAIVSARSLSFSGGSPASLIPSKTPCQYPSRSFIFISLFTFPLLHGCLFRRPLISTLPQKDRSVTNVKWDLHLRLEIGPC